MVFLDEPTAGMDPHGRHATWEIVSGLKAEGVAVLLTTHYLEEAERLADRVAIINAGRLIALDRPSALVGAQMAVRLRTASPVDAGVLEKLPSARAVRPRRDEYLIETDDAPALLAEVTATLRDWNVPVRELRVGEGTLEEVYVRLTGGEIE